jgi:hypothetical protein
MIKPELWLTRAAHTALKMGAAYTCERLAKLCKIWGFHGGDYEEWCLLGFYVVWLL